MSIENTAAPAVNMAKFEFHILAPEKAAIFSGVITQGAAKIAGIEAWGLNDQVLEQMLAAALNEVRKRRGGILLPK